MHKQKVPDCTGCKSDWGGTTNAETIKCKKCLMMEVGKGTHRLQVA